MEALHTGKNFNHLTVVQPLNRSAVVNNSGGGKLFDDSIAIPDEIKGWNWGAFLMPWLWPFTNKVWIGLLCLVPYVGGLVPFFLGAKGNEWAWKSRKWRSIDQFKAHQRGWAIAGLFIGVPTAWLYIAIITFILLD